MGKVTKTRTRPPTAATRDAPVETAHRRVTRPPTARSLVGTTVRIPASQWTQRDLVRDYANVKRNRTGTHLLFRVTGTYYHTRLRLRAVCANRRLGDEEDDETFTITPADVVRFHST